MKSSGLNKPSATDHPGNFPIFTRADKKKAHRQPDQKNQTQDRREIEEGHRHQGSHQEKKGKEGDLPPHPLLPLRRLESTAPCAGRRARIQRSFAVRTKAKRRRFTHCCFSSVSGKVCVNVNFHIRVRIGYLNIQHRPRASQRGRFASNELPFSIHSGGIFPLLSVPKNSDICPLALEICTGSKATISRAVLYPVPLST